MLFNARRASLLFFGSDAFSIRVLKHLLDRRVCSEIQVVTKKNTLLDRYSAAKYLRIHRWPLYDSIDEIDCQIGLVASFGHLIDEEDVAKFKYGLFNVHPSLLPQYRGSTPVQAAIRDNLSETGCTIMKIPPVAKFDVGEIVLQRKLAIRHREFALDLSDRLADLGADMFEEFLFNYAECIENLRAQPSEGRSYARKLRLEDGLIAFKMEPSFRIDQKVRAYTGFLDLYSLCLGGLKIKLRDLVDPSETDSYNLDRLSMELLGSTTNCSKPVKISPGTIYFHKIRSLVSFKCSDHKWLSFASVKPVNKSLMSSLDFYNGYLSKVKSFDRLTDI